MLCLFAVELQAQQVPTAPNDGPAALPASAVAVSSQDTVEGVPAAPAELSIADLQQMAFANNPTLAQAAHKIAALEGKHLQVGLAPNPVLGYVGEDMGENGSAGQQGAFVLQRIVRGGKLGLNRAVVSHEIEQAQRELDSQSLRVLNDVQTCGYEVLIAQRTVELNEQLAQIGNAAAVAADDLFKAREVSQVDVLQARVEANSAKLQLSNSRMTTRPPGAG